MDCLLSCPLHNFEVSGWNISDSGVLLVSSGFSKHRPQETLKAAPQPTSGLFTTWTSLVMSYFSLQRQHSPGGLKKSNTIVWQEGGARKVISCPIISKHKHWTIVESTALVTVSSSNRKQSPGEEANPALGKQRGELPWSGGGFPRSLDSNSVRSSVGWALLKQWLGFPATCFFYKKVTSLPYSWPEPDNNSWENDLLPVRKHFKLKFSNHNSMWESHGQNIQRLEGV